MIHKYLVYFDGQIIPSLSCVSSYRLAQAFFCFISTISWAFLYFLPPKMFQAHLFFSTPILQTPFLTTFVLV